MEAEDKTRRERHPKEKANIISQIFFFYMLPIFYRYYKNGFEETDLFETLKNHKGKLLGDRLEDVWQEQNKKHKKWGLHIAMFKIFGFELVVLGICMLFNELLSVSLLPLSIYGLLSYFDENSETSKEQAYMYAGLVVAYLFASVMLSNHLVLLMTQLGMKARVACCSLLYRKSLKLSHLALGQTTVGQIVNLLSNDVSRFNQRFFLFHFIWIAPTQAIVGTYLVYRIIGVSSIAGMGFLLFFIPLQIYCGKRTAVLRRRTAKRTDERVRQMNEMLSGIQIIKMYSWEKPFAKLIALARRSEIKAIRASLFLGALKISLELVLTRISIFITLIVFISIGNQLTADVVYPVISIFDSLRATVTFLFPSSISAISEIHVSLTRIQKFMNNDELPYLQLKSQTTLHNCTESLQRENNQKRLEVPKVTLNSVYAQWASDSSTNTLTDINISVESNQFVAVIGKVGSGKSSLLNVLLKELPISMGYMEIEGKISYAAQEAWLFSASIRQNILFGEAYDEDRYKKVLKVCALEADIVVLTHADQTIVGDKGKKLSGGQKARVNLARCIYRQADIYLLDDPLSAVDNEVGKHLYEECITRFLSGKMCILITHQLQYLRRADKIIILKEGKIAAQGNYEELETSGLDFAKLLREFNADEQEANSESDTESDDNSETEKTDMEAENSPDVNKETAKSGSVSASVYGMFLKFGGSYMMMVFIIVASAGTQGAANAGDYFISQWVDMEQTVAEKDHLNETTEGDTINTSEIISWYSIIMAITFILQISHTFLYFVFFMRAAVKIHDVVVSNVSYATMNFFNTNPVGRILNRFSMDTGIIDEYLPYLMYDVIQISLLFIGTIAVTSVINPWLLAPAVAILLLFSLLRKIYIITSRSVKRVEGIKRSPLFSHLTASLNGLSTIRASSAQITLTKEFDNFLDVHSSAWFLYFSSTRSFGFWLDFISTILVTVITVSLVLMSKSYLGGEAGLILTQYIGITSILQFGIRGWCELENNMTSVERVMEYTHVETEPIRKQLSNLPRNWPEMGKIVFNKVSMKYSSEETPVLKSLTFTIEPLEKIGIVGRTGAGKSSTIAALFQLYDFNGSIIIDGVDTKTVPLENLRSKISIIPQDPVLFSGTVRRNLDPFDEYNDETIWKALEQVQLKEVISETTNGLSSTITEGGSNFSIGQRQLLCLARAIIRNNKILVMDEATANVDPHTDKLIQETIRQNFANCTVITVAHRLHTVMDSDKILVMNSGEIVEFDHPHNLLQNKGGFFYNTVKALGQTVAKNLQNVAEKSFMKMQNR